MLNRLCDHVPYWVSLSGMMRALSVRPDLASYQTDAGESKLGVNKLRRLVDYLRRHPRSFSSEERITIRGMIFQPMACEQDCKLRELAEKGFKLLDLLDRAEKQKPARAVEVFRLDLPVPERKAPVYSEPDYVFDPNGRLIGRRADVEMLLAKPIDPLRLDANLERRPEIDIWQPVQGPQSGIAAAVIDYLNTLSI